MPRLICQTLDPALAHISDLRRILLSNTGALRETEQTCLNEYKVVCLNYKLKLHVELDGVITRPSNYENVMTWNYNGEVTSVFSLKHQTCSSFKD